VDRERSGRRGWPVGRGLACRGLVGRCLGGRDDGVGATEPRAVGAGDRGGSAGDQRSDGADGNGCRPADAVGGTGRILVLGRRQRYDGRGRARAHASTDVAGGASFDGKGRLLGSMALDGVDDYAQASDSVLDTSQSFTIAAWARPTSSTKLGVVAAVNGVNTSAVGLLYNPSTKRWVFGRTSADVANPVLYRASSTEAPVTGAWSHLLASYDASTESSSCSSTAGSSKPPWFPTRGRRPGR
jgi:hypothetical protein